MFERLSPTVSRRKEGEEVEMKTEHIMGGEEEKERREEAYEK